MKEKGFIEKFLQMTYDYPDSVALELLDEDNKTYTYEELLIKMETWKGILERFGLTRGEKVILMHKSHVEFLTAFYAMASMGVTSIIINPKMTSYELKQVIQDSRPIGFISSTLLMQRHDTVLAEFPEILFLIASDATEEDVLVDKIIVKDTIPEVRRPIEAPVDNPIVSCQYTYKGTGDILGVLHRYREFGIANDLFSGANYPQEPGAVHLAVLPIYPIFGLSMCYLFGLSNGCRLLCTSKVMDINIYEILVTRSVRMTCLVPDLLRKLLFDAKEANPDELKNIHPNLYMLSGGSSLDPELAERVKEKLGVQPYNGYGTTETFPISTSTAFHFKKNSVGMPFSKKIQLRIKNIDGQDAAIGQVGEVLIRASTMFEGYLDRRRVTSRYLKDGWFRTGDLGYLDEEGYLFIVGRSFSFTKIGAQMVDLVEVETVFLSHIDVAEARVVFKQNETIGEHLVASVVLKRNASIDANSLRQYLMQRLSKYKVPRIIKTYQRNLVAISESKG